MADYSDPKRAVAYRFTVSLFARSDNQIKITPTLAAGDVKVSKDNGALANITTLPAETPASSGILQVDLSGTEMTADLVTVRFLDAAGAEWNDVTVNIATAARQMADLAYPATSGRSMVVDASGLVDANTVKVGPTGSGTAQTAGDIMADTNDIQTRLPAALVSGRMDVSVGAMASGVLTATAIAADAITAAKVADGTIDAATFAAGAINAAAIAADAITDAKVAADVTIASVTGAVGSVTGNVGGNVVGSIGSVATGGITAGSIAADAIGASELAADAVAEIQSGLATSAALSTLQTTANAIDAKTTNLPSDPADESLIIAATDAIMGRLGAPAGASMSADIADLPTNVELATALGTADDAVLTQIALVKAKTDGLTFTVSGQVDANLQYVNDVQVTGDGQTGTEWGPA